MFKKWFDRFSKEEVIELVEQPALSTEEDIMDAVMAYEKANKTRLSFAEKEKKKYKEYVENKLKELIKVINENIEKGNLKCAISLYPIRSDYIEEDSESYTIELIEKIIKSKLLFKGYEVDYYINRRFDFDNKYYVICVRWGNEIWKDKKI